MAKTLFDSPQVSTLGKRPNPKGSDMGSMRRHKEAIVGDPQTPAPIDTTFYANVPTRGGKVINEETSPNKSSIAGKTLKR